MEIISLFTLLSVYADPYRFCCTHFPAQARPFLELSNTTWNTPNFQHFSESRKLNIFYQYNLG
jgi:hypothetical protein